jgi:hypothetical protein
MSIRRIVLTVGKWVFFAALVLFAYLMTAP